MRILYSYRNQIRNIKWCWPLFSWLLKVSIHNAWLIVRRDCKKVTQLEFRREIVLVYLLRYAKPPKGTGRTRNSTSQRVSDDIRFDGYNHLIQNLEKKRRCAEDSFKVKSCAVRTQGRPLRWMFFWLSQDPIVLL